MQALKRIATLLLTLSLLPVLAADPQSEALAAPLKTLRRIDSPLLQDSAGVVAQTIVAGSQAEAAGLQPGDLLIRYAEEPIQSSAALIQRISRTTPADSLNLAFLRRGETRSVPLRGGRLGIQLFDASDRFWFNHARSKLRLSHDGLTVDVHAHGRLHLLALEAHAAAPEAENLALAVQTSTRMAHLNPARPAPLATPLTAHPAVVVTDWQHNATPKLQGRPLPLARGELSRTLAIAPDGTRFVLGTDQGLKLYDPSGKPLWQTATRSPAWGVNLSGDGRYVVAALLDGTLRWYSAADGQERLALLLLLSQDNWLAWSPAGDFMAANAADPRLTQELHSGLTPLARQIKTADGALNLAQHRPERVLASLLGDAGAAGGRRLAARLSWVAHQNLPARHEVAAPPPSAGQSGRFYSPYTRSGTVAAWAVPSVASAPATAGTGSDIAGSVGGYVGKEVGNKLLNFVPFGLGSAIGAQVGDNMARGATAGPTTPPLVSAEQMRAQTDLSFNTAEELATYLYVQHGDRADYSAVLERTFTLYPEMRERYAHGIYRSDLLPTRVAPPAAPAGQSTSARDRLLQLQQLKTEGLITEAEFQARRSKIIEGL